MQRYLTPKRDAQRAETVRRVPIEGGVSVYRLDDGSHTVVAETADETIELGVKDAAVSRKKGDTAPVELTSDQRGLRVHNHTSKNAVTVRTNLGTEELAAGEDTLVTDDCIVELGITTEIRGSVERDRDTLSKDELEEMLGMRQKGDVVEGVSPGLHAQAVAENLRKSSQESAVECRKIVTHLENFVAEHPVDDPDYEQVVDELERITTRLESKTSGGMRGGGLDDQWQQQLDVLADRVEKLYGRAG